MSRATANRLGGVAVVVVAGAAVLEATTFDVAFPTDPLGPKAFPLLAAFLLAFGGAALWRVGAERAAVGQDASPGPHDGAVPTGIPGGTILAAAVSFTAYALLLAPFGFVLATTLEFAVLARLFGGRWVGGAAAGLVFASLLYVLFVFGLGLPLPLGIFAA